MANALLASKRIIALTVAFVLAIGVALGVGADKAWAGVDPLDIKYVSSGTVGITYDKNTAWNNHNVFASTSKKKVTKAKSSNTKVLAVSSGEQYLVLTAKKPGKAKLTYKLGGKKHVVTIVVKKYKNPFKRYKVGGKNCASIYNKGRAMYSPYKSMEYGFSGNVKITPKKNWKIVDIRPTFSKGDNVYRKGIKNGAKLPEGTYNLRVIMKNKKTKVIQRTYLYMYNDYND